MFHEFIINKYGDKYWYFNGNFHRINGYAHEVIFRKYWCYHGKYHRRGGPAIDKGAVSSVSSWYYHGKYIKCESQEEFERMLKLKEFW